MKKEEVAIFWFRRDLRLFDNRGLAEALNGEFPVLPIFIFDEDITNELDTDDARITFIHDNLTSMSSSLKVKSSGIYCKKGKPEEVWKNLLETFDVKAVFTNEDYEPYAIKRDQAVAKMLSAKNIAFTLIQDQVIFAKGDVLKKDQTPYTVYTPYKNKWLEKFESDPFVVNELQANEENYIGLDLDMPSLEDLGFIRSAIVVHDYRIDNLEHYEKERNFPALDKTSYLSPHLRFGTVSIRQLVKKLKGNLVFLQELIWREFFMQILYHFPKVVTSNFKSKYDHIEWRNNEAEFEKWKEGKTGYPIVDAGIRQLNATGYMHNRVRMVVAGFLCKHLLIDWRWGEAYFSKKLLDYELSSNNGNWQWSAGTGCDSAPYFRVFNPTAQINKFDKQLDYINQWVPELNELDYPAPMVDHKMARVRALATYKKGLQ